MKVEKIVLTNFRNHKSLVLDTKGHSVIIRGPNGAGKTNILEAIYLLSTAKSLRTKYDRELIRHDAEAAHINAIVGLNGENAELEVTVAKSPTQQNGSKKLVKINKVKKAQNFFTGTFNCVFFTPEDINIITGSPSLRRRYIDLLLFQISKKYKKVHSDYLLAVRQRNKLLENMRENSTGRDQIGFWNEKILEHGAFIQTERKKFFGFAQSEFRSYLGQLNSSSIEYEINYKQSELSEERLREYESREIASANTLIGPHREDFSIFFDGYDIGIYGSRGQQRTAVLGLKLCEIDYIEKVREKRPVLLLDDIFSELDPLHKEAVEKIIDLQQTFITTAQSSGDEIEFEKKGA